MIIINNARARLNACALCLCLAWSYLATTTQDGCRKCFKCDGTHHRGGVPLDCHRTNLVFLFCRYMSRYSFGVFVPYLSIDTRTNVVLCRVAVASAAFILYKACTRLRLAYARQSTLRLNSTTNKMPCNTMHATCGVLRPLGIVPRSPQPQAV